MNLVPKDHIPKEYFPTSYFPKSCSFYLQIRSLDQDHTQASSILFQSSSAKFCAPAHLAAEIAKDEEQIKEVLEAHFKVDDPYTDQTIISLLGYIRKPDLAIAYFEKCSERYLPLEEDYHLLIEGLNLNGLTDKAFEYFLLIDRDTDRTPQSYVSFFDFIDNQSTLSSAQLKQVQELLVSDLKEWNHMFLYHMSYLIDKVLYVKESDPISGAERKTREAEFEELRKIIFDWRAPHLAYAIKEFSP